MGGFNSDRTTGNLVYQLSSRFQRGGPLEEMAVIQKEFKVFSQNYSLQQAFRVLHIVPSDFRERRMWFRYLDYLKTVPSDQAGVNGHDRIIKAYQENLESRTPLPMYTTTHRAAADDRVLVTQGRPFVYEDQDYIIISHPAMTLAESGRSPTAVARRTRGGGGSATPRKSAPRKRAG
jgi:hypothetical protein